jgi:hypothetical protein
VRGVPYSVFCLRCFHLRDTSAAECREASEHFGACLTPFLRSLAFSDGSKPFASQTDIPVEIHGAIITDHGSLTPGPDLMCEFRSVSSCTLCVSRSGFDYIADLRASNERAAAQRQQKRTDGECTAQLQLSGHLFDKHVINQVLDLIERSTVTCEVLKAELGKDVTTPSKISLKLFASAPLVLHEMVVAISTLASANEATIDARAFLISACLMFVLSC